MTAARVWIDGTEVTSISVEGSSTRRLNRPSQAQVKVPMQDAIGGPGSLLKIEFDGWLHHHGRVLLCETEADEDAGYTVYNSTDPLEMWKWRPVRDPGNVETWETKGAGDPGDLSAPDIVLDYGDPDVAAECGGPRIIEAMIDGSEGTDGDGAGSPPADAEGPLFLAKGTFEPGVYNLQGAPVDYPMTMADLASLLISTGKVDIVITPIELDIDGNYGQIDVYNGDYGLNLASSVAFQYGMGLRNVRHLRWNQDMSNMANKIWWYLGRRKNEHHWRASITGIGSGVPPASLWWADCGLDPQAVIENYEISQAQWGVRMDVRTFEARGDDFMQAYCLYRYNWMLEAWFRANAQTLIHITPTRDTPIGDFDIGDVILVEASPDVKGGFSGVQRVYEYTISWEASESVPELSEIQVSSDQEDFA